MGKQEIKQTTTNVPGVGTKLEQSIAYDENNLPTPQEMEAYQKISPAIVEHILSAARLEQQERHNQSRSKVQLVADENRRKFRINRLGMFLAAALVLAGFCLAAFALYLDRMWFAVGSLFTSLVSIVTIFARNSDKKEEN